MCGQCKKRPTATAHFNSKFCKLCALERRKRPLTNMTRAQIAQAKKLIGKMPREEIAQELGVSLVNLKRAFRGTRLAYHNWCVINPVLVKEVNKYYGKHGVVKTAEHFNLKRKQVEHIVYRYKLHKPRRKRWTERQFIQLARFGGLIPYEDQAKYFKRPNAHAGSIKSAWMKKFGCAGGSINGMSQWQAKYIVTENCPYIRTKFWESRKPSGNYGRKLYLWVDMEKHLQPDLPDFMKNAIYTLANFQRWLHGNNAKRKIQRICES